MQESKLTSDTALTYRPDVDGLRAVAVLAVMCFHAFPARLTGGFVGVDVFFVISGFLISGILVEGLRRESFSFRDFYARRIRRIFPALIVVLCGCGVYGWFFVLPNDYAALGKHVASAAGFVANLTSWRESGYFDLPETKPLLHLWSLGIEEQFYMLWPVLLWVIWKTRLNVLACTASLMLLSATLGLWIVHTNPVAAFYSPFARFWELLLGACLALVLGPGSRVAWLPEPSPGRLGYRDVQSAVGLACIGAAMVMLKPEDVFPGWLALLPTLGAFLVISAGPDAWLNRRALAHPALVWIGLISYPLYPWHWPLLHFVRQAEATIPTIGIRAAVLLASVALAWATYAFVERPIRFGAMRKRVVFTLCGLMLAVGLAGYVTYRQHGLPSRYPASVGSLLQYNYDYAIDLRRECFLSKLQDGFPASCDVGIGQGPSVLLWGDSHAGRLYPGLTKVAQNDVAISSFAREGCPPIGDFGEPFCGKSNRSVLETVQRVHPMTVILFANWTIYAGNSTARLPVVAQQLLLTIEELRQRGVPNIVVIGPAPLWNLNLPALLAQRVVLDAPRYRIPERLSIGLFPDASVVDAQLERVTDHLASVRYVSLMRLLCNSEGCLTHVPGAPTDLITWDTGHLTTAAGSLVGRYLLTQGVLQR